MTLRLSKAEAARLVRSAQADMPLERHQKPQDARKVRQPRQTTPAAEPAAREQDIQRAILDALAWRGVFAIRLNSGAIRTEAGGMVRGCPPGTPDILCIVNGAAVFLEVKRPGKRPTALQTEMHARLRAAGARVAVVTSVDEAMEEIER